MGESVVRRWVSELTFKQQTVLLSALRGCDGIPKEDCSKQVTREFRGVILKSAVGGREPGTFMGANEFNSAFNSMLVNIDHYPVHWLFHLMHACEIVGYKHPDERGVRRVWFDVYDQLCYALHVNPETEEQLDRRLRDGDDREVEVEVYR